MKITSVCERERKNLEKMNNFQLSNQFKKIGYSVAIGAFILMIARRYFVNPEWVKPILHGILLIGLLFISLAKEKVEDEFIDSLRSQSYRIAFILAIVYSSSTNS